MITIHFEYFVWCSWFVGLLSLLNFVPKSLFCGKARAASGPPGVRRNDPHQRCPGKIHHQKPRGQWSAKMEGCCSLSWTRKWMNMSSCIVVRNFKALQKHRLNALISSSLLPRLVGWNNPGPILFALFRCPTRCWKHHVLVVESAEGLMQTSCDISVSHHQQRHRQKQQQRRNTASATITNCGKEESENNNVLFSSERASQRF